VCEYRITKPSIAFIMIGTNDAGELPLNTFRANLTSIVETTVQMGIIPVLSTIPPRHGMESTVSNFNGAIVVVAHTYDVPLWDYWSAMNTLPNNGLSDDGVHPSWPPGDVSAASDFTSANLAYGYTIRNLMALQVLDAVWRQAM
jgi:lysophospholipase L1-like esterase